MSDSDATMPAARCVAHQGAHAWYQGACYAFAGAPDGPPQVRYRRLRGACPQCGATLLSARLPSGQVVSIAEAAPFAPHACRPTLAERRMDGLEAAVSELVTLAAEAQRLRAARAQPAGTPTSDGPRPPLPPSHPVDDALQPDPAVPMISTIEVLHVDPTD